MSSLEPGRDAILGGERQLHLRDILHVLGMHWKVIGIAAVVVVGAAYNSATRATTFYRSDASFQIGSKKTGAMRPDEPNVNELELQTDPVLSEALILQTQNLALQVVDSLGLQLRLLDARTARGDIFDDVHVGNALPRDTFTLRLSGPAGYELRDGHGRLIAAASYSVPVRDTVHGLSFTVRPSAGERTERFVVVPRVVAGNDVRGGLGFSVHPATTVVNAWYQGTDPSLAPDILNAAISALSQSGVQRLRELSAQREAYLRAQLAEASSNYQTALTALQRYKEAQGTVDISAEEQALLNSVQTLDHERQQQRENLALLQGILGSDTTHGVTVETLNRLAAIPNMSANTAIAFQLQNLLKLYDDRRSITAGTLGLREDNPSVQALDQRIQQAGRALRQESQATAEGIRANIEGLDGRVRDLRARLAQFPGKETQIGKLQLDASLFNDTYRYLMTQLQSAQLASATIAPYIQVVETATVGSRIGITTRQRVVVGLLVGLFLGIVIAFFLEYLDQTIKTASDVERALKIPVLGLIPIDPRGTRHVHPGRRHGIALITSTAPDDPTSEAYRTLRTNVTFVSAEHRALQLICITSAGPGEGKSTTAANLAITLAQQGSHTLLVDADLRRPLVHRAFNLVQEPGLTDILIGTSAAREAIRPNVIKGLDVLPGGALPPNPSELLGSEAMHRLLGELRSQYDTIIFDTPPALAVTDATVLGTNADAVILVIRVGETDESAAQRAVEGFRRVQARVAGAVLNGVEKTRDRYYYYYYGKDSRSGRGLLARARERLANII
ncbi:MAG: polysaccharide biosynthesis tyrosine autokinase [Gemmatimonadales bacterium]